jgi:hypothetical protein
MMCAPFVAVGTMAAIIGRAFSKSTREREANGKKEKAEKEEKEGET